MHIEQEYRIWNSIILYRDELTYIQTRTLHKELHQLLVAAVKIVRLAKVRTAVSRFRR